MPTITYSFSDDTPDGFFRELWLPHKLKAVFFFPLAVLTTTSLFSPREIQMHLHGGYYFNLSMQLLL